MSFLEQFSQQERDLIVSLPYRAGLWVSLSDSDGGAAADQKELDVLEGTIAGLAQGMFESAFVHDVVAEVFLRKSDWAGWTPNVSNVPQECRAAIGILTGRLPQRDIDAYRHILMQIGLEVARAFREYNGDVSFVERFMRGLSLAFTRMFGLMRGEKFISEHALNVSYEEDKALNALAQALRGRPDGPAPTQDGGSVSGV